MNRNEAETVCPQQLLERLLDSTRLKVKLFIESCPAAFGLENLITQTKVLPSINKRILQLYQEVCETYINQGVPFDHSWVNSKNGFKEDL